MRSKALQKKIDELTAKQAAILDAAENSDTGGVLSEDQKKEFDAFETEKASLQAAYDRAVIVEQSEARSQELTQPPIAGNPTNPQPPIAGSNDVGNVGENRLPAGVRRYGSLQAFKGQNADYNAYAAGMWTLAIFAGDHPMKPKAQQWCERNGIQATMWTGDNASAGFLVPTQMDNAIIELTEQYGVFRRYAEIQPMTSGSWNGPRWTGSMVSYWVAEKTAPTQSDPRWDRVNLMAKDLAAMTKITNQLNEDSVVNLGDKVAMCAAISFAAAEDNAGFEGDGTSTYGGIVGLKTRLAETANAASLITAATGHDTLPELTLVDFNSVLGAFPEYPGANPAWFCHKAVWAASMVPLQLAAGGATLENIVGGGKPQFLGYPVVFVQTRPTTYAASTIPIFFGDLKLSSKMGVRRERSIQAGWENDDFTKQQFTLLATERVDIANHTIVDPITTTKAGPIMGLKLAA